jgi:hypothetical protein
MTTTVDGATVVRVVANNNGSIITANDSNYPTGLTGVFVRPSSVSSGGTSVGVAYGVQTTAGSSGTATWTGTFTGSTAFSSLTFAIAPSAGGSGTTVTVDSAPLTLAGQDVFFQITQPGEAGSLVLTGQEIEIALNNQISVTVEPASLLLTGLDIEIDLSSVGVTLPGMYAPDGSMNVVVNGTGIGMYSILGGYRIDTLSAGPGIYGPDGAFRGVFDTEGFGLYDPSGALRLTTSSSASIYNNPGIYAKDGSLRVTVVTP